MERELFVLLLGVLKTLDAGTRRPRKCRFSDHDIKAPKEFSMNRIVRSE